MASRSTRNARMVLMTMVWLLAALGCAIPTLRNDEVGSQISATLQSLTLAAPAMPTVLPSPSPSPPPTIALTETPETSDIPWKPCQEAPDSQLHVGDQAYVSFEPPECNRVRKSPNKNSGEILGNICPGEMVEILEGPICNNQWVWWKVHSLENNLEGWTVEGDEANFWLIPAE